MRSQNGKITILKKFLFLVVSFSGFNSAAKNPEIPEERVEPMTYALHSKYSLTIPYLQKNFVGFKEALAFKESQGDYSAVNTLGYLGKYQFGASTLERFKIYNTALFLKNPELQERVFIAYCRINKWILRKDIQRNVGKIIDGVTITESGILASAHLSGAGNVKKYLRTNGARNPSDAYGTSIRSYMKKFARYDVSFIKADRKATI